MQPHNIIFDLDETVVEAISYGAEEKIQTIKDSFGTEFLAPLTLESLGYPHLVFPGFYALFRWIHSQGGNIHLSKTPASTHAGNDRAGERGYQTLLGGIMLCEPCNTASGLTFLR